MDKIEIKDKLSVENLNKLIEECNTNSIEITSEFYDICKMVYCNIKNCKSEVCA